MHMYMYGVCTCVCVYLHNLWLVAGADRENLEKTTARPQQFLIRVQSHDPYQIDRATAGQDYQLTQQGNNSRQMKEKCGNECTHLYVHVYTYSTLYSTLYST